MTYAAETRPDTKITQKILGSTEIKFLRRTANRAALRGDREVMEWNEYINRTGEERIAREKYRTRKLFEIT